MIERTIKHPRSHHEEGRRGQSSRRRKEGGGGYLKYPPLGPEAGPLVNHWGNLVGTDGGYLKNPPRRLYLKNSIVVVGGYLGA